MKLTWRTDPDAEAILGFVGIDYEVKTIKVDDFDWIGSSNNCARLQNPLNDEKIEEYHRSMERGDVFPMVMAEDSKNGYIILGGNQRMAAVKRFCESVKSVDAYTVKPLSAANQDILIRSLNSRHGWGSEKEERIEHAQYLVRKHGVAVDDAARLMSVSSSVITDRIRAENTRSMLAKAGVNSVSMPLGALLAVSRVKNERAAVKLAKCVAEYGVPVDRLVDAVRSIESAKSVSDVTKTVNEFAKEAESSENNVNRNSKVIKSPRRDKIMRKLEDLSHFLERGNDGTGFSSMEELQCTRPDDADKIRTMIAKITIRLSTIGGR